MVVSVRCRCRARGRESKAHSGRELPGSRTDQLIVRALVEVCEGLGIKTVAEFVTDEKTMEMVRDLGVDFAQGYHLGKPEPVSALRAS